MTAREMIEKGIAEGDLALVGDGWAALSGRRVEAKASPAGGVGPLREALAWYADPSNYSFDAGAIPVLLDEGAKARGALGGGGTKAEPAKAAKKAKPAKEAEPAEKPARGAKRNVPVSAPPKPPRPPGRTWDPPEGNLFRDTKRDARADLASTRWICRNVTPVERRPEHHDPEVKVPCDECGGEFWCRRSEVRHKRSGSVDSGGDVGTENYCPKCLRGSSRGSS